MGELCALWRLTVFSVCSPVFSEHLKSDLDGYLSQNDLGVSCRVLFLSLFLLTLYVVFNLDILRL